MSQTAAVQPLGVPRSKDKILRLALVKTGADHGEIKECALQLLCAIREVACDAGHLVGGGLLAQVNWSVMKGLYSFEHWCTLSYGDLRPVHDPNNVTAQNWHSVGESIKGAAINCPWADSPILASPAIHKQIKGNFELEEQIELDPAIIQNYQINARRENFIFVVGSLSTEMLSAVENAPDPENALRLMLLGDFSTDGGMESLMRIFTTNQLSLYFIVRLCEVRQKAVEKIKAALALVNGTAIVRLSRTTTDICVNPQIDSLLHKCLFLSRIHLFEFDAADAKAEMRLKLTYNDEVYVFGIFLGKRSNLQIGHSLRITNGARLTIKSEYEVAVEDKLVLIAAGSIEAKGHTFQLPTGSYVAATKANDYIIVDWMAGIGIAFIFEICTSSFDPIEDRYICSDKRTIPLREMRKAYDNCTNASRVKYKLGSLQLKKLNDLLKGESVKSRFTETRPNRSVEERLIDTYRLGTQSPYDLTISDLSQILQTECDKVLAEGTCDKPIVDWVSLQCVKKWNSDEMGDIVAKLLTPIWRGPIYFQNLKSEKQVEENVICNLINVQVRISLVVGKDRSVEQNKRVDHDLIFEIVNLIRWARSNLPTYRNNPMIDLMLKNPWKLKTCDSFLRALVNEIKQEVNAEHEQNECRDVPTLPLEEATILIEERKETAVISRYCDAQNYTRTGISEFNSSKRFISMSQPENIPESSKEINVETGVSDIPMYHELEQRMNQLSPFKIRSGMKNIPTIEERFPSIREPDCGDIACMTAGKRSHSLMDGNSNKDANLSWTCGTPQCPRSAPHSGSANQADEPKTSSAQMDQMREQVRKQRLAKAGRKFSLYSAQVESQGGEDRAPASTIARVARVKRDISVLKNHPHTVRQLFGGPDQTSARSGYLTRQPLDQNADEDDSLLDTPLVKRHK